jgi:hypothetical protein
MDNYFKHVDSMSSNLSSYSSYVEKDGQPILFADHLYVFDAENNKGQINSDLANWQYYSKFFSETDKIYCCCNVICVMLRFFSILFKEKKCDLACGLT